MVKWAQVGILDPRTVAIVNWFRFYELENLVIVLVLCFVLVGLVSVVWGGFRCRGVYAIHKIEALWTILPGVVLLGLAVPSLRLLYITEVVGEPRLTVKVVGHQWYWSYELGDFGCFSFDSYIEWERGVRLIEVDKRLVLPIGVPIRVVVTGADVIHSWAVPGLGVKMDACPGRLNQVGVRIAKPGVFRGMCSELCGVNHAYMPIVVEGVSLPAFISWRKSGVARELGGYGVIKLCDLA